MAVANSIINYIQPTLFIQPTNIGSTYIIIDKYEPQYPDEPIATFSGKLTTIEGSTYHFTNLTKLTKLDNATDPWVFEIPEKDESFSISDYIFYEKVDDIPLEFKDMVSYYNMNQMENRMGCDSKKCTGTECKADGGKLNRKTKRKKIKRKTKRR